MPCGVANKAQVAHTKWPVALDDAARVGSTGVGAARILAPLRNACMLQPAIAVDLALGSCR